VIEGYGNTEGTGGSFDFYTLGESLFDEQGNLNAQAKIEAIREYIWFTETRQPLSESGLGGLKDEQDLVTKNQTSFLGTHNETDYYFCYDPNQVIILDMDLLGTITQKASQYLIYADSCELSEEFLNANNIIFKKIPRDITRL
jgi:adenine-specific DNA-methyltransferase